MLMPGALFNVCAPSKSGAHFGSMRAIAVSRYSLALSSNTLLITMAAPYWPEQSCDGR